MPAASSEFSLDKTGKNKKERLTIQTATIAGSWLARLFSMLDWIQDNNWAASGNFWP